MPFDRPLAMTKAASLMKVLERFQMKHQTLDLQVQCMI